MENLGKSLENCVRRKFEFLAHLADLSGTFVYH